MSRGPRTTAEVWSGRAAGEPIPMTHEPLRIHPLLQQWIDKANAAESRALRAEAALRDASDLVDEWTNGYGGDIGDDHFPVGEFAGQRACDYCRTDWPCTSQRSHEWLTEHPSARLAALATIDAGSGE